MYKTHPVLSSIQKCFVKTVQNAWDFRYISPLQIGLWESAIKLLTNWTLHMPVGTHPTLNYVALKCLHCKAFRVLINKILVTLTANSGFHLTICSQCMHIQSFQVNRMVSYYSFSCVHINIHFSSVELVFSEFHTYYPPPYHLRSAVQLPG